MCTLSWEFSTDRYSVFFNRDELRSRAPAEPIRRSCSEGGVDYIHPVDGARGGSWIVSNAHGVTTCLLNLYEGLIPAEPEGGFRSRGWLVMALADSCGWEESLSRFSAVDPNHYPPFHLFQFDPLTGVRSIKWTGTEVVWIEHAERCERPASGSSFENEKVVAARRRVFQEIVKAEARESRLEQLREFHDYYDPKDGAYSVKMMRDDAQTMSFSRIEVDVHHVGFEYLSREPGTVAFSTSEYLEIPRKSTIAP